MPVPDTFRGWVAAQVVPLSLLAGFLSVGVLILLVSAWNRRRRLLQERAGEDMETFVDRLRSQGYDPNLSRLVYFYLVEQEEIDFPIRPRDMFEDDLCMSQDEVQALIKWVLFASGRSYTAEIVDVPLYTVMDAVRVVQLSPFSDAHGIVA